MVDCGPDLRQQLLDADVGRLDGLIVTHAHGDHCHGIDELRPVAQAIGGPVPLHARSEVLDELRQRFVNLTVAQAKAIDLTLPDPDLRYNEETQNWDFGPIDWDEFWRVVKGDGPCNADRLAARNKAHEEGEWVRKAATAYAAKQSAAATEAA